MVDLTSGVTGILPVANGGLGLSSLTSGSFLRGNGTNAPTLLTAASMAAALGRGYCSCNTAAATVAKVATCSGFELNVGAIIGTKFAYANTVSSPTLNVNATGAKTIYNALTGAAVVSGNMSTGVHFFIYDGTYWWLLNPSTVPNSNKLENYVLGTSGSNCIPYVDSSGITKIGGVLSMLRTGATQQALYWDGTGHLGIGGAGNQTMIDNRDSVVSGAAVQYKDIKLDFGVTSCTYSQGPTTNNISFHTTFSSPPIFIPGNTLSASGSTISAQVAYVTTTGARIDCYHPTATGTRDVPWIAIGA